jgi:site-specific recombinase XerD
MNGPKETSGLSPFDSSPDTATLEDVRLFQLHLAETGMSIGNRNRIMTGVRFLFRVTLWRLDLAAEIYHLREPQKIPQVVSPDEARRLLAGANSLKARVMLSLCYGCGLRAGEVVRLKVKHIDSAQRIIRIEQSKGRKLAARFAAQYPACGLPCERFKLSLAASPCITWGRGGWLGLTP